MKRPHRIHLDMDGVVADWNQGVAEIIGYALDDPRAHYPQEDWQKLKQHEHLYRNLPLLPHAEDMANLARRFRDELGWSLVFLTAIPHYNDMHWSFWDKCLWAQEHFPDIPVHFGPYSVDKQVHCKPGDILVDDRTDNCQRWRGAGGTAILVDPQHYVAALRDLYRELERLQSFARLRELRNNAR